MKKEVRAKKQKIKNQDIIEIRSKRFLAMIIDWYLSNVLASIPVTFYLRGNDYIQSESFYLETYGFKVGLLLGIYVIVLGLIYYMIIPTFVWKGQTLGKKICHIQIVQEDESQVTFKNMFLREVIGQTFLEGGIVVTATYFRKIVRLLGYITLVDPLKYIAYALTLASIIYAYFQPSSQSFHDKIAKTIVVKMK